MWSPKALEVDERQTVVKAEPDTPPLFRREKIDLGRLIERVYVWPELPNWVARVVTEVTAKYLDVEVVHSDLAADPVY